MVAVPVIPTDSPSAAAMFVVEADARVAEATALVDLIIADIPRM